VPHEFGEPLLDLPLQRRRARSVSDYIQHEANSQLPAVISARGGHLALPI
jgi:hypothetical protein